MVLILEIAIDLDNVGVVEEALYLKLPYELSHEVILYNTPFFDDLQSHDEASVNLSG